MNTEDFEDEEPVEMPINGILDLHTFSPKDVKELLPAYFDECMAKGIFQVRVIHGKGTGALREFVHAQLRKSELVDSFNLADQSAGSWGSTIVCLKKS